MNPTLANHVHKVIGHGLDLKEKVEKGSRVSAELELERLRDMLYAGVEVRNDPDYVGDGGGTDIRATGGRGSDHRFLGARFALACWLDEIFTLDSPLDTFWNENKLEQAIFRTNDRAWKFWEQAALAEKRASPDALEVYYWCAVLGFRGELSEQPDELTKRTHAWRDRIRRSYRTKLPLPADRGFDTHVPVLAGRGRFDLMVKVGLTLALASVIPLVFFIFK